FGATVQKCTLRLAGAVVGGALGIATIVVAMPNLETIASLLLVSGVGFFIAGWILAGSARISYVGLQAGMAFSICVTDPTGPTTDLTAARDRVIGILLGVLAVLFVSAVWPARARLAMWSQLARTLRTIAGLARLAPAPGSYRAQIDRAVGTRTAVYQQLAATVRLAAESERELDAHEARAEREWIGRLAAHAQAGFLAILALRRHRLSPGFPALPPAVLDAIHAVDQAAGEALDALADQIERGRGAALPDLASPLAALEALAAPGADAAARAARDHAAIARDLVRPGAVPRDAVA